MNTWVTDSKSLLTFGGKSVDYGFYQINADKTFNLSFLANENVLEVLKTQILPRLEPSGKDDDDYIDEATESYKKELAERIKSVQINDAVIIIMGVYVVIPGKEDNVDLNIFMTKNSQRNGNSDSDGDGLSSFQYSQGLDDVGQWGW